MRSAQAQDIPVQVLAVDNRSTDGTAQWLRTGNICTIFPQEQWSLARCWNTALIGLWTAGHDYALVINNDIEMRPNTARLLRDSGRDFVTGVSVNEWADDYQQDTAWTERMNAPRPHPDFSCFFIRKVVTDRAGWFNEECFPAYMEDGFYHAHMWRLGIRAVCLDLPFLHHRGSTLQQADPGEAARIRRGADRNREMFRRAYGCLPGTTEYEALFSAEAFGMDIRMTERTKPLEIG